MQCSLHQGGGGCRLCIRQGGPEGLVASPLGAVLFTRRSALPWAHPALPSDQLLPCPLNRPPPPSPPPYSPLQDWARTPLWKRAEYLHRVAAVMRDIAGPIAEVCVVPYSGFRFYSPGPRGYSRRNVRD